MVLADMVDAQVPWRMGSSFLVEPIGVGFSEYERLGWALQEGTARFLLILSTIAVLLGGAKSRLSVFLERVFSAAPGQCTIRRRWFRQDLLYVMAEGRVVGESRCSARRSASVGSLAAAVCGPTTLEQWEARGPLFARLSSSLHMADSCHLSLAEVCQPKRNPWSCSVLSNCRRGSSGIA